MTFGNPDNVSSIMINNSSNVFVSLTITGFINANTNEIIKAGIRINIKVFLDTFDDRTYCIL